METPEEHPKSETDNRIALWPGRNREKGSEHPYLTGKLTIDGKDYFVTLWKRDRHSASQPLLSGHVQLSQDDQLEI